MNSVWKDIGPNNSLTRGTGTRRGIGPIEFITIYDTGTVVSTRHMLAGSLPGGLFYSDNAGETWQPAGSDTKWNRSGCSHAIFHPKNHEYWYASTSGNSLTGNSLWIGYDGGVFRTMDKGNTWDRICSHVDMDIWNIIYKIVITSYGARDVMCIASSNGLYRASIDTTNPTWTKTLDGFIYDIEVKPGSPNHLYATVFDDSIGGLIHPNTTEKWYIMESDDYGQTWTDLFTQPKDILTKDKSSFTIEVSKAKPNFLYCLAKTNRNSDLFYIDLSSSTSWTKGTTLSFQKFGAGHAFGVEQTNGGNNVFISYGTTGKCFNISTDSIMDINPTHDDLEDIVCHPYHANEIWIAHHGGIDKSMNNGINSIPKSNGINVAQVMRMASAYTTDSLVSVGLYHDGTVITDTAHDINWKPSWRLLMWGDGMRTFFNYLDPSKVWCSRQDGNWIYNNTSRNLSSDWQTEGVLNKCSPNIIYRIGYNGSSKGIQRSFDKLRQGKAVIVIAHRLQTILNADEICVLENGEIIDRGSHSELLENSVRYKEIMGDQLNG